MNVLFKTSDEIKVRRYDRNIHKAVRIPVSINEKNKTFTVAGQQKMHVNWNLQIIYGYHLLTSHSLTL